MKRKTTFYNFFVRELLNILRDIFQIFGQNIDINQFKFFQNSLSNYITHVCTISIVWAWKLVTKVITFCYVKVLD